MSDIVGATVNFEPMNVLDESKFSCNAQEQEVNDLSEFLKLERNKFVWYKILYEALEESVKEKSELDGSLKIKVKKIMINENVAQVIQLDDNQCHSGSSVFNFHNVNDTALNYYESDQLKEVLKLKLEEKYKYISTQYTTLCSENVATLQMSSDDKILIGYKNKLILEQEQYIKNLLELLDVLIEISNLKLQKLPLITNKKIEEYRIEEKINYLKSLLTQEKVRVDIFMETGHSLEAYKELIKDIKNQQKDYQKDMDDLKKLKEKYEKVSSCKQYEDILKSYLQYKSSIEKKKLLYDSLKR